MLAHAVSDSQIVWYPILALGAPALIVAVLTGIDRARRSRPAPLGAGGDAAAAERQPR